MLRHKLLRLSLSLTLLLLLSLRPPLLQLFSSRQLLTSARSSPAPRTTNT
jgi:hypothetical protein